MQLPGHSGAAAATRLATKTAAAPPATRLISPTVSFQTIIDFLSIAEGWLALKGYKIFKPDPFPLIPTVPRLFMLSPPHPRPRPPSDASILCAAGCTLAFLQSLLASNSARPPQLPDKSHPPLFTISNSQNRPWNLMKLSPTHFYRPHPALSPPPALGYDKTAPPDVAATEAQPRRDPASPTLSHHQLYAAALFPFPLPPTVPKTYLGTDSQTSTSKPYLKECAASRIPPSGGWLHIKAAMKTGSDFAERP